MKKLTKILALMLALVLVLSLAACSNTANNADADSANMNNDTDTTNNDADTVSGDENNSGADNGLGLLTSGVISIGLEPTYPPFEEVSSDGVTLQGYDIDLARALAEKLGVEVDFISTSFDGIFAGLGKQYDLVISGVTITEDRKAEMIFSTPYITNYQAIVARKGTDISISSLDELSGRTVSVQKGTTSDELLTELIDTNSVTDVTNVSNESIITALSMVSNGEVDLCMLDSTVANVCVGRDDTLEIIYVDDKEPEEFAVAIEKTNTALQEAINNAMKELENEGFFTESDAVWFG